MLKKVSLKKIVSFNQAKEEVPKVEDKTTSKEAISKWTDEELDAIWDLMLQQKSDQTRETVDDRVASTSSKWTDEELDAIWEMLLQDSHSNEDESIGNESILKKSI